MKNATKHFTREPRKVGIKWARRNESARRYGKRRPYDLDPQPEQVDRGIRILLGAGMMIASAAFARRGFGGFLLGAAGLVTMVSGALGH